MSVAAAPGDPLRAGTASSPVTEHADGDAHARLRLVALSESRTFAGQVALALGTPLTALEERVFEDGEHKARVLSSVRGCDVYVLQSLQSDADLSVNDKLVRLLFLIGALKDAAAARVTAVMPYLCYARKDRKSKSRDPVSSRYVTQLIEAVGTDRVVTLDVHNLAAYQNAFRIGCEHLEAKSLFAAHFARRALRDLVVVSPDIGGVKRAEALREALQARLGAAVGMAFMQKARSGGVVSGDVLAGDVSGRSVIIIDDLISSGTTLRRTIAACRDRGAARVACAASHGLFTAAGIDLLAEPALEQLLITDSVPPPRLEPSARNVKLVVISVAPLFAEAIRRLHREESLVELLEA